MERRDAHGHDDVQERYDEAAAIFEEGMARMALYHRHCQDPVIFRTLGDVRGKPLLDLACGNGFYTRRFRKDCGADPGRGRIFDESWREGPITPVPLTPGLVHPDYRPQH